MKIFFYSRPGNHISEDLLRWSLNVQREYGYDWGINREYAEMVSESFGIELPLENRYSSIAPADVTVDSIMVAVGGDGTFLEAVYKLRGIPMPIIGVNMGRLGFLAQVMPDDIPRALAEVCAGRYTTERRTMLEVEGDFGTEVEFPCALNEFTIHRHTADMIEVAVYSGGELLTVIHGDGVIASTPTGSTAYSLSAGGPIVIPDCACFVYSAIAPHNFSIRPMVFPDTSVLSFEVRTRGRKALASLDNRSFIVGDGVRFTIKKSEFSVFLMQIQNISFYDTLRDRTMWGIDKRDGAQEKH